MSIVFESLKKILTMLRQSLEGEQLRCIVGVLKRNTVKIPKISPRAYIFQRPLLRGLFLEGRFKVNRGVFALRVWGGLYLEGLIHGGTYFQDFTILFGFYGNKNLKYFGTFCSNM